MCLIENIAIIGLEGITVNRSVLIENGKIKQIVPAEKTRYIAGVERVDGEGYFLAPGYIDLHIHGIHKHLVDAGSAALTGICEVLPQYGVTGFLPTLISQSLTKHVALLQELAQTGIDCGSSVLGFHLEGPYLGLAGALPTLESKPDKERIQELLAAGNGSNIIFSVGPEVAGINELIPLMRSSGVPVFISHTGAGVKQTQDTIAAGASHATHFYDVFPVPAESEPGVRPCGAIEAILADREVSVDFILDNVHVDPVAVKMALACKGPDKVCLITDANVGAGLGAGSYDFGGREVVIAELGAPARFGKNSPHPGTLAGSGLTMDRAVRNAVRLLGVEPILAVRMASFNPAQVLGLASHKGKIEPEFDADLVLLDRELRVQQTWVKGKCCYVSKKGERCE